MTGKTYDGEVFERAHMWERLEDWSACGVGASAATVRRCLSRTWPKKEWKRMTLNISSLVERLEDERDELKDRSRIAGEFSALDPMTAQRIANTMFEAGETISALTKQLEERDRVATEAVEFIGVMRDEMVIAGWPSGDRTVLLANVRALLSTAPSDKGSEGQ